MELKKGHRVTKRYKEYGRKERKRDEEGEGEVWNDG